MFDGVPPPLVRVEGTAFWVPFVFWVVPLVLLPLLFPATASLGRLDIFLRHVVVILEEVFELVRVDDVDQPTSGLPLADVSEPLSVDVGTHPRSQLID